jgi:hypothetical protein
MILLLSTILLSLESLAKKTIFPFSFIEKQTKYYRQNSIVSPQISHCIHPENIFPYYTFIEAYDSVFG